MPSPFLRWSLLALSFPLPLNAAEVKDDWWTAARQGNVKIVEALLAGGADVNAKTSYGATALSFAADKGHVKVVRVLLEHKANPNVRDSFYTATPLTWALYRNHWEVVKLLVEAGAEGGEAALVRAAKAGRLEVVQAVLDRGKVKADMLESALAAAPADRSDIAAVLKKAGAKSAPKVAPPVDPEALKALAGVYQAQDGNQLELAVQDGKLTVLFEDKPLYTLVAIDKVTFKPVGSDTPTIAFKRNGDKVAELVIKTGATERTYRRVEERRDPVARPTTPPVEEGPVTVLSPQPWPSFRGLNASGVADGQSPPTTWNIEKGHHVRWKTPLPGLGHSCPVVWGGRVFLTTAISGDVKAGLRPGLYGDVDSVNDTTVHTWRVYCLDKGTGKILWEQTACQGVPKVKRHLKATHANPTPATDGKHVVACFGSEGLYCYDCAGKLLWKRDLGVLDSGWFYDPAYQWGFASSPIIYRNKVLVQCDIGKNSFLAAFGLETGNRLWLTPREEIPSWGTPTIYEGPTGVEVITNATKYIRSYDPVTGYERWRLGKNAEIAVPTPIVAHDLIFVTSGYRPIQPIYAIRPGASGDISLKAGADANGSIAWSKSRGGPYIPTPIVYGDHLYICNNNGILTCSEARTGKQVYQRRMGGKGGYSASPVAADGKLYFTSEEGDVRVVKAGPRYELLALNLMGDTCMATPAISDGILFVRTQQFLYALGRPQSSK